MKRILIIFSFLLPFLSQAQQHSVQTIFLTKDSLNYDFDKGWKFHVGDSAVWAQNEYDDSAWEAVDCELRIRNIAKKASLRFSSIGWLRLHISVDSSLTGIPLALSMSHYGASEVYFDGKKIKSFGKINGPDSSEYHDPQDIPFIFTIPATGKHLIAVRYANFSAAENLEKYNKSMAGFRMEIGLGNISIRADRAQTIAISVLLIFLFSAFFALSVIHMFLYLYYRVNWSNLFFSIFCLSLGLLFFLGYLGKFVNNTAIELRLGIVALILTSIICLSLSGFINELFSASKLRFRFIALFCLIAPVLYWIREELGLMYMAIIIIVSLEAVVLTARAIYRKVRGARIIGFGILFFGMFFLVVTIIGLIYHEVQFNDSTTSSQLLELFGVVAILSMPISMSAYLAWNFGDINKNLINQLEQVKVLSERTLEQEREKKLMLENRKEELEKEVALRTEEVIAQKQEIEHQHEELKKEKKKSDDLLLNILPEEIAEELKERGSSEAKFFDHVTVLFTDFVDFTKAGEQMTPRELVSELDTCFKAFDEIISIYNIEKIKTIGDAYLAVCGVPANDPEHAIKVVRAALGIRDFMASRKKQLGHKTFDVRIGIHSGSVVAGIVGVKKFAYDIWGDTVNTAARMEQSSEKGKINISQVTYELIKDQFECSYRGEIEAKNKGALSMYFVEKQI